MSYTKLILLIMKYVLLLIPISFLLNNGFMLEGGFLALYLLFDILYYKVRDLEQKVDRIEEVMGDSLER